MSAATLATKLGEMFEVEFGWIGRHFHDVHASQGNPPMMVASVWSACSGRALCSEQSFLAQTLARWLKIAIGSETMGVQVPATWIGAGQVSADLSAHGVAAPRLAEGPLPFFR